MRSRLQARAGRQALDDSDELPPAKLIGYVETHVGEIDPDVHHGIQPRQLPVEANVLIGYRLHGCPVGALLAEVIDARLEPLGVQCHESGKHLLGGAAPEVAAGATICAIP
jgi:hypothetical protein